MMKDTLSPILELSILLPGMLLAYLPVKEQLRIRPARLVAAVGSFAVSLCLILGFLCYYFKLKILWVIGIAAFLCGFFYVCTLNISRWKSVSVFLAVSAVFSCLGSMANVIHGILYPGNDDPWLSLEAVLVYVLICWVFVFISWYPATHAARKLVQDEAFAQTWYVFWILPLLFIGLNLCMTPSYPEILQFGRVMQVYITFSFILLVLLLLFYVMFYLMAASLNRNDRLRQENLFLSMQQAQYSSLRTAISETREARHDMRHHLNILHVLAERREWEALTDYLTKAKDAIPDTVLNLCENAAADAVASYYAVLYKKNQIPFSIELDLPEILPVPEIDFCLVLSNLLENALEASLHTEQTRQYIQAQAYLHSNRVMILTIKNNFDGTIREKDGIFQSFKRSGNGVGIQSVCRIAEKNGGSCRFTYDNGVFWANVMLRG